jgi:hypothetical protein
VRGRSTGGRARGWDDRAARPPARPRGIRGHLSDALDVPDRRGERRGEQPRDPVVTEARRRKWPGRARCRPRRRRLLRHSGHGDGAVLDSGPAGLARSRRAALGRPRGGGVRRLRGRPAAPDRVGADELGGLRLLDARAPERFRGNHEPIDPVGRPHPGCGERALCRAGGRAGAYRRPRNCASDSHRSVRRLLSIRGHRRCSCWPPSWPGSRGASIRARGASGRADRSRRSADARLRPAGQPGYHAHVVLHRLGLPEPRT